MIRHNTHIEASQDSRLVLHPIVSVILFILLFIIGQALALPFILALYIPMSAIPAPLGNVLQMTVLDLMIPFATTAGTFMAFTVLFERRPIKTLGFQRKPFFGLYLKGFGLGIGLMLLYLILALATGTLQANEIQMHFDSGLVWLSILLILPGWMIQGASEEIITRGWLYQSASLKYGGLWGLILAPGLFGVLHLMNNNISLLSEVNLVLFGLFAVFYVLNEGSLWGICGLHSAWNWTQGNLLGIEVSGNPVIGGSLIKVGPMHGASYMTGAGFGAEGSILVTIVYSVGILWLLYRGRQKASRREVDPTSIE